MATLLTPKTFPKTKKDESQNSSFSFYSLKYKTMNETNLLENQPIAWTPSPDVIERAQLTKFMKQVGVSSFDELYQYSIADTEKFTAEVLKFLDIKFDPPYEKLLDTSNGVEFPNWLAGAGLNITEMCLDRWQSGEMRDQTAIIWEGEEGNIQHVSYAELQEQVEHCAAGLRADNLGKGDAICIHLPMMIETIVALLAINRIGAIAVPVFSGYGVEAIASRMNAVKAKALITCDGFPRRGKEFDAFEIAAQASDKCPTLKNLFVVNRTVKGLPYSFLKVEHKFSYLFFDELIDMGDFGIIENKNYSQMNKAEKDAEDIKAKEKAESFRYPEKTLAEDPLIILYTSGTTGKPKGIAHTHASFPIKAAQDMAFGMDVGRGTRISWITDIGWMMGPWLIYGALINGATICLYDGAPDYPTPDRMWEFSAKHKVEVLGISPTLVRALATHGDELPKKHDLSSLRAFASTGEPWNPAPWWWLFEKVGRSKLPIINYSGGTEISGGILCNNPLVPIKPCGFSAPCPGMDVDILDENGEPVGANEVGELVIKQPWIGMARGFWGEKERYLETYWNRFENIWVHGDWAMRDSDEHYFILGRSDDTLKVAGKRVGPAEVESLLVAHEAVAEAAVIGVPDDLKGTKMIAFVVLKISERENLEAALKSVVAKDMGKPLAPSRIHFVTAIPKTRNAKVMRRVIRAAYLGEDAGDLSALENPQSVGEISSFSKGV
jgi:acetyl-CoA synthetase